MIDGAIVVITGASSGIGEATARYLAARGVKVVLGARHEEKLRRITNEINAAGGKAVWLAVDVCDRKQVSALAAHAVREFGGLDVFVANAGAMPIGLMQDLAVDDWNVMVDVNIKGVLWGIAAALPIFQEQRRGHFIAIASTAARKTVPTMAVYSGTKAAVVAICDGLRQEMAGRVRVTTILPGYTATNFAEHIKDPKIKAQMVAGEAMAMPPEAISAAIAYAIEQPDHVNIGELVIRPSAQA